MCSEEGMFNGLLVQETHIHHNLCYLLASLCILSLQTNLYVTLDGTIRKTLDTSTW